MPYKDEVICAGAQQVNPLGFIRGEATAMVRLSALAQLANQHSKHNKAYRGDLCYDAYALALNNLPCVVIIRECGYEMDFTSTDAKTSKKVFGDHENKWFYGEPKWLEKTNNGRSWYPGDPLLYGYEFVSCTALEAITNMEAAETKRVQERLAEIEAGQH